MLWRIRAADNAVQPDEPGQTMHVSNPGRPAEEGIRGIPQRGRVGRGFDVSPQKRQRSHPEEPPHRWIGLMVEITYRVGLSRYLVAEQQNRIEILHGCVG